VGLLSLVARGECPASEAVIFSCFGLRACSRGRFPLKRGFFLYFYRYGRFMHGSLRIKIGEYADVFHVYKRQKHQGKTSFLEVSLGKIKTERRCYIWEPAKKEIL